MSTSKNILIVTQWSYKDALIQAYTLPYVLIIADQLPAGSKIFLVTFEQKHLRMSDEEKENAKSVLLQKGIHLIDYSYSPFGIISILKLKYSFFHLLTVIFSQKIKFIHAWCTPAGALGYLLSIFSGKPLIIDSYEPHAEAMVENKTWSRSGFKYKLLFYFEKKLSRRAEIIISATEGMREYAKIKYGVAIKNFFVKPACVDLSKFNRSKRKNKQLLAELGLENKIVCVYTGKFGGIYLSNEVFDFFHEAEIKWGDRFRALLLTNHSEKEIKDWAEKSNFSIDKMIMRFVPHGLMPDYSGLGDFGITPVKPIPTKRYCTPIKDGEYWALGLPVVITKDISDDSSIIERHNAGAVITELSSAGYKTAIEKINSLLEEPKGKLAERIENVAKQYRNFEIAKDIYRTIYKKD